MLFRQRPWTLVVIISIGILFISSTIFLGIRANTEINDLFIDQFIDQQSSQAHQISASVSKYLIERVTMLQIVAKYNNCIPEDNFKSIFRVIYNESRGFYALEYINKTGVIVSGHPEHNVPIGYDLYANEKNKAFDHVKSTGEVYITDPMHTIEGDLATYVWIPLYDKDNNFNGAILALLRLEDITAETINTRNTSESVYLIDNNARLLYDSSGDHPTGKNYFDLINETDPQRLTIIGKQIQGEEGSGIYFEMKEDGSPEHRIVSYVPVNWHNQQWSVGVVTPRNYVDSLIQSVYVKQGLFAMASIGIVFFISSLIVVMFFTWNKALETEVKNKTSELEASNKELLQANEELKKLDKLKTEFVSMVSHELKTPLTAMKTSSQLLKEDCNTEIKDEMLDLIIRNIDRQTRMVDDLLDISRIESGKVRYSMSRVNVRDTLNTAMQTVEKLAEDKDIRIKVDAPEMLPVCTDRDKLVRVFVNLLTNAIKFSPEGGEVRVTLIDKSDHITAIVEDNGIGIPAEKLSRIFDKFYQVDGSSTRKAGGSGLGLAIIKGILEGQGGDIRVESKPGKGSAFTFTLPKGDSKGDKR